jgi:hypothetical protein
MIYEATFDFVSQGNTVENSRIRKTVCNVFAQIYYSLKIAKN